MQKKSNINKKKHENKKRIFAAIPTCICIVFLIYLYIYVCIEISTIVFLLNLYKKNLYNKIILNSCIRLIMMLIYLPDNRRIWQSNRDNRH